MKSSMQSVRRSAFAAALLLSTALTVVATPAQAAGFETFAASKYTYCDATLLSKLWKTSVYEAKVSIGDKIANGIQRNIGHLLAQSRAAGNACSWADTGYSYQDAEKLAKIWGLAQPYEAKNKVAAYLTNGQRNVVDRALRQS